MSTSARTPQTEEERADPRIDRWARKARGGKKNRRIRRRIIWALGLLLLVGGGLWTVYLSPFLDVDKIRFSGITNASTERIEGITDDLIGSPMARIEIEKASERLRKLPWVKEVKIRRSWWGGDISVSVTERTPVAVQAIADGFALVSREGKILQNVSEAGEFPVIEGVANAEGWLDEAEPALETAEQLGSVSDLAGQVRAVVVAERGEIFLDLLEGGWVRLGDSRELPEKLRSVRTFLQEIGVRCDQMLDVRSPLVPAMTSGHNCKV